MLKSVYELQSINQSIIYCCKKTIKLTPRPRMALNGATLQQQLTVHNTGAEQQKLYTRMLTTRTNVEFLIIHT